MLRVSLIFALSFFLFTSTYSYSLSIGVEKIDYAPYYFMKKGRYMGFARDVFDLYSEKSGNDISFRPSPVAKLNSNLLSGKVSFRFPDNAYWSKKEKAGAKILYSEPVISYTDGLMVMSEQLGKGLDNIKKVGTIRGFSPISIKKEVDSGTIKIIEYSHIKTVMKKLSEGEIDAIYFNVKVLLFKLQKIKTPYDIAFDSQLPHSNGTYHLSSTKNPEVIKSFNQFLADHQQEIQAIKEKHGL